MEKKERFPVLQRWWLRHSIRDQIFLSMLLLSFIAIGVLGNVAYRASANAIEENYGKSHEATLKNSSKVIDLLMNAIVERARENLHDDALKAVLGKGEAYKGSQFSLEDQRILKKAAETLTTQEVFVNGVAYMDLYGHSYLLNNTNRGSYGFDTYYREHSYLEEEWCQDAKAGKGKEVFFGEGVLGSEQDSVICFVKYLINPDTSEPMGYMVVNLSKSLLGKSFVVLGSEGYDTNVYMMVDKVRNNGLVYFTGEEAAKSDIIDAFKKGVTQNQYLFSSVKNDTTGWELVNVIDKNELSKESKMIRNTVFLCGGGIVLLCFFLARGISGRITKPLNKLEQIIQKVGKGERHISENFDDSEVGRIGQQFKEMVNTNLELSEHLLIARLNEREAELLLLQSQINPHFLYNTLDSLYCMAIIQGNDEIGEMVLALSNNFKLALNNGEKFITVIDSIKGVQEYMKLQNMRYNNRFDLFIDIKREILQRKIISFILQPFVENAMYHGLEPKIGKGFIRILGWQERNNLMFTIEDDGVGIRDLQVLENGYGIRNVKERIHLNYGEKYGIKVQSEEGVGTKVTIVVPVG